MNNRNFSDAELLLIKHFNVEEYIEFVFDFISVYKEMMILCFLNDEKNEYSEALRKAYQHLMNGGYRLNNEFDNLIMKELRKNKLKKLKK